MSWSRRATLTSLWALAACGFRPLYGPDAARDDIANDLAGIAVVRIEGRLGQILDNALEDELDPIGLSPPPDYDLIVGLTRTTSALAIQPDATITRYDMILSAPFALRRREDGAIVTEGRVRRVASYNVRREPYATLIAEQDAERRAAQEVAREIANQLALHFNRTRATP